MEIDAQGYDNGGAYWGRMKTLLCALALTSALFGQVGAPLPVPVTVPVSAPFPVPAPTVRHGDYWTPRRKIETAAVTMMHAADASLTCYHMAHGWGEDGLGTPHNCPGAAAVLIGSGPVLQYASYHLARKFPRFKFVERALPYVEIGISANALKCSEMGNCRHGF